MEFKIGARIIERDRTEKKKKDVRFPKTDRTSKETLAEDDIILILLWWEDGFDCDEHLYGHNVNISDEKNHDFTAMYITRYLNLGSRLMHSDPKWQN